MNHFCLAASLLGTNLCDNDTAITAVEQSFISHMAEHGLSFGTEAEYKFRLAEFQKTDAELNEINANPENTFTVVHNQFSTMTKEEFENTLNYKLELNDFNENVVILPETDLLESVDHTKHMASVQNQGHCGSCWAFSATGVIEGHHHMKTGQHVKLSEQQLVDCEKGSDGCDGGDPISAMKWASHGQTTSSSYPYTAKSGHCKKSGGSVKTTRVNSVKSGSVSALKAAIQNGPTAIVVNASARSFKNLGSGILNDKSCSPYPNHAIIAVGYGSSYYIVRNSWGTNWASRGYGKVGFADGKGICGIQSHSGWAVTN